MVAIADLSQNKKFVSKKIDLKGSTEKQTLEFTNDIKGQLVASESGKNIVVTAYATKEVDYQETEITYEKIESGKYKGKYYKVTNVYKAEYDEDGNVTGFKETTSKTTRAVVKKEGIPEVSFQMLDAKGKVIAKYIENPVDKNKTVVDTAKVLGTITLTNGDLSGDDSSVKLQSANNTINDLISHTYSPVKKKNSYTGNWQNEMATSTSVNESFNLGGGDNTINYNLSEKFGKDKIILSADPDSKLTLNVSSGEAKFSRSGNNIIMSTSGMVTVTGDRYEKHIDTIEKVDDEYRLTRRVFVWDEEENDYIDTGIPQIQNLGNYDNYKLVVPSVKEFENLDYSLGTHEYFWDTQTNKAISGADSTSYATLTNYLKNSVDNVFIGEESLKTILNNSDVVNLGDRTSIKKQKLVGTFLDEKIVGGAKNDTISTGAGDDAVTLSKGTDTVTIDGAGVKKIKDGTSFDNTKITFAKNVNTATATLDLSDVPSSFLQAQATAGHEDANVYFVKDGNNLILDCETGVIGQSSSTLTVTNFFGDENIENTTIFGYDIEHNPLTLAGLNPTILQFARANKATKLEDTKYNNWLLDGNKNDTFTISHTGNNTIILSSGNDVVNIKKSADEGFTTITQTTLNAGADRINIEDDANPDLIVSSVAHELEDDKVKWSFEKTGGDLTLKSTYAKGFEGLKKNTTATLTLTDYFSDKYSTATIAFFGEDTLLPVALGDNRLIINGVADKQYGTYFEGTALADDYTYSGKGKALMKDEAATNDHYTVSVTKKSNLVIDDAGGEADAVVFASNIDNLRLYFDVDINEDILSDVCFFDKGALTASNLVKVDRGTLVGAVQITNYKGEEDSRYSFTSEREVIDVENWVYHVQSDVYCWLCDKEGKYQSASEVFASGNNADIKDLLQCYNISYDDATGAC